MTECITHHHLLEVGVWPEGVADGIVDLGRWWVRADEVPTLAAAWLHGDGYDGYGYGDGGDDGGYGYGYDGYGYGYDGGDGDGYDGYDGYGYGRYGYGGYSDGYGDGYDGYGYGKSACADALARLEAAK